MIKLHRKIKHDEKVCHTHDLGSYAQGQGRDQVRGQNCVSAITTEAILTKLHREIEHYDKVFYAQELGSYAQGQGSLAVFKVTARDQGLIRDLRGHLLHTVTFLVFFSVCFSMERLVTDFSRST